MPSESRRKALPLQQGPRLPLLRSHLCSSVPLPPRPHFALPGPLMWGWHRRKTMPVVSQREGSDAPRSTQQMPDRRIRWQSRGELAREFQVGPRGAWRPSHRCDGMHQNVVAKLLEQPSPHGLRTTSGKTPPGPSQRYLHGDHQEVHPGKVEDSGVGLPSVGDSVMASHSRDD